MKLVELLAEKLEKWADTTVCYVQDPCGSVWPCKIKPNFNGCQWVGYEVIDQNNDAPYLTVSLSSDYASAVVTKSMWQAERDRQKGGEWKRHRGRKQPVEDGVFVEYKLRGGVTGACPASQLAWSHMIDDTDVMQYRVISQPQAEEVEVKDTTIGTISYKISVDQIAGPLCWRDTIIHCQAIIEDCEREIQRNVDFLDAEGLMIQTNTKTAMQHYEPDVDMSDWRNWKVGDVFITDGECQHYTKGKEYSVHGLENDSRPIEAIADNGDVYCLFMEEVKFVRRP